MKLKGMVVSPALLLFSASAFAQDAAERGGAITGRIVGPILIAFVIWQLVKRANKNAAYRKQLAERRKLRAEQDASSKPE